MKLKANMIMVICFIIISSKAIGAYIEKFPQTLTQPNGKVINCFISGDEFYGWLHDKDNYTIIQNPKNGYYCYADYQDGGLVASKYIVGIDNPTISGIKPGIRLSNEQISYIRSNSYVSISEQPYLKSSNLTTTVRTLNNIVVYIRFADQTEFGSKQTTYSSYFNSIATGANSMYNYFSEASYQNLNIVSLFYLLNNGTQIISYKDSHTRNYYCPWTAQNDSGYSVTDNGTMMKNREWALVANAVNYIKYQIPSSLDIDSDTDGHVDNICFIIRGAPLTPTIPNTSLLWPHAYKLYYSNTYINSKLVYCYNFQIEDYLDVKQNGVLCHEMFHTIGAGDLYHSISNGISPVGSWDLMATTTNPPQSMCADYKYRYGRWISIIPEITVSGHYTLNPITSSINNCFKIPSSNTGEYFMLEFRQKTGTFESSIPGTGLIIYRIDKSECCQNITGPPDWIYIYRPDGTITNNGTILNAYFDSSIGRSTFHNTSNPYCFLSDGSLGNIFIKNITVSGNLVSFDVRFCNADNVLYSNTNQLPPITNAVIQIQTSGSVIVKNTDNIIFEAGQEIILNSGFEVQLGGQFETNMNSCGNQ